RRGRTPPRPGWRRSSADASAKFASSSAPGQVPSDATIAPGRTAGNAGPEHRPGACIAEEISPRRGGGRQMTQATRRRLRLSGGSELSFITAGAESGPAVLLLHGFPSAARTFRDVIPRLAESA